MKNDKERFRDELAEQLERLLLRVTWIRMAPRTLEHVHALADELIRDWTVERNMNHIRDANGFVQDGADLRADPGPESEQTPLAVYSITILRDQTTYERAEELEKINRVQALADWKYGKRAHKDAPPADVSILDLLEQKRWWVTKDKTVMRVRDMTPGHRRNLLWVLRRKAIELHMTYCSMGLWNDAPDDVINELVEQDPYEWLDSRPLVQKLTVSVVQDQTGWGKK